MYTSAFLGERGAASLLTDRCNSRFTSGVGAMLLLLWFWWTTLFCVKIDLRVRRRFLCFERSCHCLVKSLQDHTSILRFFYLWLCVGDWSFFELESELLCFVA